jgi:hypothetical protein
MKSHDAAPGPAGKNRLPISPLPLEWMDPMSWRLPSGKALAEFALQSGFLAPLWMSGSMGDGRVKRKKKPEEVPVVSGRFRRSAPRQG